MISPPPSFIIVTTFTTLPLPFTGYAGASKEGYGSSSSAAASSPSAQTQTPKKEKDVSKWNPSFVQMVGQLAVNAKKTFDAKNFTQILGIGTNRVGGLALAVLKDPNKKRTLTSNGRIPHTNNYPCYNKLHASSRMYSQYTR